jgi:hypothetical protein
MPVLRVSLRRSRVLVRLTQGYLVALALATYIWGAAHCGRFPATLLSVANCTIQACVARRLLRRGPRALELGAHGTALAFYPCEGGAARAVCGELVHAVHWPGILLSLELGCADRTRRAILVSVDALALDEFRALAAWARRSLRRKPGDDLPATGERV